MEIRIENGSGTHSPPPERRHGPPDPVLPPRRRALCPRVRRLVRRDPTHRLRRRDPPRLRPPRRLPRHPSPPLPPPSTQFFRCCRRPRRSFLPPIRGHPSVRGAAHNLRAETSSSPTVSALVIDITLASTFIPVAAEFRLPTYVLFTSSAAMLSLCAYFPAYIDAADGAVIGDIDIPGVQTLPKSSVPPALHNPAHLFTTQFVQNGRTLAKADGIVVNTFDAIERDALAALNEGRVAPELPPAIAVGPLPPLRLREGSSAPPLSWLDAQPPRSVVYVGFGSRTAMSSAQIRELAVGLELSGCKFLWVIKSRVVDREEEEEEDGEELSQVLERVKGRGMVVKGWVEQEEVLGRESVGGFVSHCGWNSVTEAAATGTPVLAWPRNGDQRVNADVVRRCGLGIWVEEWSWEGDDGVVKGEEIGRCVRRLMDDQGIRASAARVREAARNAAEKEKDCVFGLSEFVRKLTV